MVFSADIQSRPGWPGLADEYSHGAAAVGDSLDVDCHDRFRGNENVQEGSAYGAGTGSLGQKSGPELGKPDCCAAVSI